MADTTAYDATRHLQLLDNGKFSDFEVICGDHTIKCHRSILCTQSEYFQKLAEGNFKNNGKATFPDDSPALIARMLVFLYTGRYIAESFSPDIAITQFKQIPDPYTTGHQKNQLHIAMYGLGDKICNEKLRRASRVYFYDTFAPDIWSQLGLNEDVADIVGLVYETAPECDRGLRDLVVRLFSKRLNRGHALDQAIFRKTLKQVPDFAFDLVVHPLSSTMYKCKHCGDIQQLLLDSCSHHLFSEQCSQTNCSDAWLLKHWCPQCNRDGAFEPYDDEWR